MISAPAPSSERYLPCTCDNDRRRHGSCRRFLFFLSELHPICWEFGRPNHIRPRSAVRLSRLPRESRREKHFCSRVILLACCNGEVQQIQFAGAFETKIQGRLGKRETNTCLCPPCIWTNIYFSDTIAVDLCEQAKFTACSAADRSDDAGGIGQIKIFITGNSFVFYICNILAGIAFTVFSFLGYVRIRALVGLCCFARALFSVQHAGNPRFICIACHQTHETPCREHIPMRADMDL